MALHPVHELALEPHPATPRGAVRAVAARVRRMPQTLELRYAIEGDLTRLRLPPPAAPRIAAGLWQHTCCELFVARQGRPEYQEFNFSLSGEWAAYAFSQYRERAPLADVCPDPAIAVRRRAQRLELDARVPLAPDGRLSINLAAVLEHDDGALSCWALAHPAGKPDFHHRDGFRLLIDEVRD